MAGWPRLNVAQTDVLQRLQLVFDRRDVLEEIERFGDGHLQNVGDRLALVGDLQRFAVVAPALADLAGDVDIGQEVHLDLDDAFALARFAAAALDVEGEPPRHVAPRLRFRHRGVELADRREQPCVGGGVGARRSSDRALIDVDHLVEKTDALEGIVHTRLVFGVVELLGEASVERVGHQRALAGAGNTRHADELAEREAHGDDS